MLRQVVCEVTIGPHKVNLHRCSINVENDHPLNEQYYVTYRNDSFACLHLNFREAFHHCSCLYFLVTVVAKSWAISPPANSVL